MERSIITRCLRENKPFPDKILNAPVLLPGLGFFLSAFWDLSTTRQLGMAVGPIPWDKIQLYGEINCDSAEQIEDLHFLTSELDEAYLKSIKKD